MANFLDLHTRHKTFVSYHHDDEDEVDDFINFFDHDHDIFISRGIGASMPGDVINSDNDDYIKRRIRALYLADSTVTLVMIGAQTWGRKFVDWEIAASLRNTATSNRNGLVAITLPSVSNFDNKKLPDRLADNVNGANGYARWMKYPSSTSDLAKIIDDAYDRRTSRSALATNSRALRTRNAS